MVTVFVMSETERPPPSAAVLDELPPPLPAERIVALNAPKGDLHTVRGYEWNGWTFEVPPGVFRPGLTSAMIFDRVLDGRIEVRDRRYLAMGTGLGVEAVAAGTRGAARVWACDVHPASVEAADAAYRRLVGDGSATVFVPVVADLLDGFPDGAGVDVVTFNPPAVSRPVSDDPDVVRNVCAGAPCWSASSPSSRPATCSRPARRSSSSRRTRRTCGRSSPTPTSTASTTRCSTTTTGATAC